MLPLLRARAGVDRERAEGTIVRVQVGERLQTFFGHATLARLQLADEIKLDARPEYIRASLVFSADGDRPAARVFTTNQVSSRLLSATRANLLLRLPPRSEAKTHMKVGELLDAIVIDRL